MARQYGDKVEIVGVAGRDEIEPMREFVRRHGLEHIDHVADLDGGIWAAFDVPAQPAWIFVDAGTGESTVVRRHLGVLDENQLAEAIEALSG